MIEKTQYRYSIIRSSRKTLCLELRAGGVLTVRAPIRASMDEINRFVVSKHGWIERNIRHVRPIPAPATPEQEARMRARAREHLPELVWKYSAIMGVKPTRLTITGAQKRLGSCSSKGAVCFSYRLMGYPQSMIEYIVVHELAHMKEMNHSPAFYRVIEKVLPDYKQRKALIKQTTPDM